MKKLIILALMAIVSVSGAFAQVSPSKSSNSEAMVMIQTNASKNCSNCATRFEQNVPFFKGVKSYTYDKATAKLSIKYDPSKTNPDALRKEISKMGYNADNVPADAAARAKLPACCRGEGSCSHDAAKGQHQCKHAEGQKCQHADGQHQCQHQCQGAQGQKCQHAEGQKCQHQCQGAQGQKCQHAEGQKCQHQCQGTQGQKCQHAEGQKCQHQCQGAQGEHKCNHECQGSKK